MDTAPISELQKQYSCTSQEYQDESQSKPFREERVSNCDSPQPNIERSIAENCTPNLKAAREAEMAMHRQQAEVCYNQALQQNTGWSYNSTSTCEIVRVVGGGFAYNAWVGL